MTLLATSRNISIILSNSPLVWDISRRNIYTLVSTSRTKSRTFTEQVCKTLKQTSFCSQHASIPSKLGSVVAAFSSHPRTTVLELSSSNPEKTHYSSNSSPNSTSFICRDLLRNRFQIKRDRTVKKSCHTTNFHVLETSWNCSFTGEDTKFVGGDEGPKRTFTKMGDSGKKRVCIIGSGNWGSAIAKIVGDNVVQYSDLFENTVNMYVYEELVDGRKLTEIINQDHENVKYLPGHKLPTNIIAVPDVVGTAKDADILIFVIPHQFIKHTCKPLVGKMKPGAFGLSLIKGFDVAEGGGIELISSIITNTLSIPCNVLMGANLAGEIADGKFSETTIGARDVNQGRLLHKLIQTNDFRVVVVQDVETVELCGALKNIVAVGAGFIDGLQLGDNTKAAVIRLGLMEMVRFNQEFFNKDAQISTFLESCGVADLITTCYGGRNRKVSEAFVRTGKPFDELEKEMLNGQRLQGPMTAAEVNVMLKNRGLEDKFPLFTAVHRISTNELKPNQLIDAIRNHPEHMRNQALQGLKSKL